MMKPKPGTSKDGEPQRPSVYYNLDEIEELTKKNIHIKKILKSRETSREKLTKLMEASLDSDSGSEDSTQDDRERTNNRLGYLNLVHKVGKTLIKGGGEPPQLDKSGLYFQPRSVLDEWKSVDQKNGFLLKTGFLVPYEAKNEESSDISCSHDTSDSSTETPLTCVPCGTSFIKVKSFVRHMKLCKILRCKSNQNIDRNYDKKNDVDVTTDGPPVQLTAPTTDFPSGSSAEKLLPFFNAGQRLQLLEVPPLEPHAYHEHFRGHITPTGDSVPVKVKPLVTRLRADFEKLMTKLKMKSLTCVVCKVPSPPTRWVVTSLTNHALHKKTHTNSYYLKCQFCSFSSRKVKFFFRHTLLHTKEEIYSCRSCSYRTRNYAQFSFHKLRHFESKGYQCSKCSFKGWDYRSLKKHYSRHLTQKTFFCTACPQKFVLLKHLLKHMDSHVTKVYLWKQLLNREKSSPRKLADENLSWLIPTMDI